MSRQNHFILVATCLAFILGCNTKNSLETYRKEAQDFCDLHNPEQWKAFFEKQSEETNEIGLDLYSELDQRINNSVKSTEFQELIAELNQVEWQRQLYPTAVKKISKLIQQPWECAYYKSFYAIDFYSASEPISETSINLLIAENGTFLVDSYNISTSTLSQLKTDLSKHLDLHPVSSMRITPHRHTPIRLIANVMKTMGELGIQSIDLALEEERLTELQRLLEEQ